MIMSREIFVEKLINELAMNRNGLIIKDLKTNLEKYVLSENLTDEEIALLMISLSKVFRNNTLNQFALEFADQLNIDNNIIEEAKQIPGINGMLNSYHKFRHYIEVNDKNASYEYGSVGLKMGILSKPLMNPGTFEIIFISISIINGCEKCVIAHENHATHMGVSRNKIHDAVRIASILKGFSEI